MSDFRIERARLRLSDDIGLDPNAKIDSTELCWVDASGVDANSCGVMPLREFFAADFPSWREDDKWFAAEDGLDTVSKLISHYERIVSSQSDPLGREMSVIERDLTLLREVAIVLAAAKSAGVQFCIAVSDQ